jgi:hypothetical protein
MASFFQIDSQEIKGLTEKLKELHRSAYPVTIRQTLNDAAFEAKKIVPNVFDDKFTVRKKNFIKTHTAAVKSKNTFDIDKMESFIGVIKGKSLAGNQLQAQELGGTIPNRDYLPLNSARVGKNRAKLLSKKYWLKNIKPTANKSMHSSQAFIRAAFKAGKGGFVQYDRLLFEIKTIKKGRNDKLFIKANPIYSFRQGYNAKIDKNPFLKPTGERTAKKIPAMFVKRAEKRLRRVLS